MMEKFVIEGQKKLHGTVQVGGSKNAALPILCAALLSNQTSVIKNVPDISDIRSLLKLFEDLKVKTQFENNTVTIDPSGLEMGQLNEKLICSMRGSVVLLAPLLSRFSEVDMPLPGGCVLGKRSFQVHTYGLRHLGIEILEEIKRLHLRYDKLKSSKIILPEMSVTATENLVMLATLIPGTTEIHLAAMEPHVQDLCLCLNSMGANIKGIGTPTLIIEGVKELQGAKYSVTGDYLQAGTYAIAGLVTHGELTIKGIHTDQLDSFWQKLTEINAKFELKENEFTVYPSDNLRAVGMLQTAVYPSFATDLQAPFSVLLTQCKGESKIFETLFESRLNYLFELEKMKAKIQILNPHQAIIHGPIELRGVPIASWDIRAGAAMVLAALCARGTTEISNIQYIDRGYERFAENLSALGASIQRVPA